MTREIWRVIPTHDRYEVSQDGRVRLAFGGLGAVSPPPLKPWRGSQGESMVTLQVRGVPTAVRVRDLVAEAFARASEGVTS